MQHRGMLHATLYATLYATKPRVNLVFVFKHIIFRLRSDRGRGSGLRVNPKAWRARLHFVQGRWEILQWVNLRETDR